MKNYLHLLIFISFSCFCWSEERVLLKQVYAEEPSVGYENGFFVRSSDGNYLLKINLRTQTRVDMSVAFVDKDINSHLSMQSAFLRFQGNFISPLYTYLFQYDFSPMRYQLITTTPPTTAASNGLQEFFADFGIIPNNLHIRVGRMKSTYARQEYISSANLVTTGRPITQDYFGFNFGEGVMLHNGTRMPFEWSVGVLNNGAFSRLGRNWGGIDGYQEADLKDSPLGLALGISVAKRWNLTLRAQPSVSQESLGDILPRPRIASEYFLSVDAIAKYRGLTFSTAGYAGVDSSFDFKQNSTTALGAYAQAAWVIHKRYQPLIRYAAVESTENNDKFKTLKQEVLGGFSMYFLEHDLKLQTELGFINSDNWRMVGRIQLQFNI